MKIEQLRSLVNFIEAKASEIVANDVGLSGLDNAWSEAFEAEKDLYETFGFDYFEEKDKESKNV